jgi:hypothetical protein
MTNSSGGTRHVRLLGLVVIVAGAVFAIAGVATYATVSHKFSDQRITVSSDASHFAGQQVTQPWQAYAQAVSSPSTPTR